MVHEPWMVALSVGLAIQGAYVALGLTLRVGQTVGLMHRLTLGGAAFTFAVSIWSMHFVGMLALRPPMRLDYLVLPTLLSLLVSVFVAGLAVFVASRSAGRSPLLALAAIIMGAGIATMHYLGMMALHGSAVMQYDWRYVVASFAVAVGASALGMRFAFSARPVLPLALSAAVFGIAISGMHYVAMAGTNLQMPPMSAADAMSPGAVNPGISLSPDVLAVVVAVVASAVSAVFLLTLVPERGALALSREDLPLDPPRDGALPLPASDSDQLPEPPRVAPSRGNGPLGGAGGPMLRQLATVLPVGRDGASRYLQVGSIVFVRADTHYCTVFDGQSRLFCPLSIGDVERRLDPARFLRVHRSYLVAVDRITGLRRAGDGGVADVDTTAPGAEPVSVPVSRGRYPTLKARLRRQQGNDPDAFRAEIGPVGASDRPDTAFGEARLEFAPLSRIGFAAEAGRHEPATPRRGTGRRTA